MCTASGIARSRPVVQHLVNGVAWDVAGRNAKTWLVARQDIVRRILEVNLQVVVLGRQKSFRGAINTVLELRAPGLGKLGRREEFLHLAIGPVAIGVQEQPQGALGVAARFFRIQIADRVFDVVEKLYRHGRSGAEHHFQLLLPF